MLRKIITPLFKNRLLSTASSKTRYLYEDSSQIKNFKLQTSVVTCFIQYQDSLLVLKRSPKENQSFIWGTPGGKIEKNDATPDAAIIREISEETGIKLQSDALQFIAKRYSRVPGWDYILYIYHTVLNEKPYVQLSDEHIEAKWVPCNSFKSLLLLTTQDEAFDLIFDKRKVTLTI